MAVWRSADERRRGSPTDLSLGTTGAIALVFTVAFYGAVILPLQGTYVGDLFAERGPVPYGITFLSAWAFVMLAQKYRLVTRQREVLSLDLLPERIAPRITPESAPAFRSHLDELPGSSRRNALVERVRRALHHFEARRDAREMVDQLSGQAQADADAVESSYTMVKVFIWAVPILGFIGTVVGIGAAVGGFSESVGAAVDLDVMKNSIGSVTSGLGIAFDTTLLALVMSILIMFPASSLQKAEEDFLAAVEDYCDERLVRRLDDGSRDDRPEEQVIRDAIAREMERHHMELRSWQDRLGQIGETLTGHVVSGWEKIDEQMRVRQDQQLEQLGRWASARQREASEELSETQRSLVRDFHTSLEGMAAEARRIQEQAVHRLDDQLVGIERLHRRVQDEQLAAAETHRGQNEALAASGEQLAHTLARVRAEAGEVREEGTRQLGDAVRELGSLSQSAQSFQRGLIEAQEEQVRLLQSGAERLAATLARVDQQLARLHDAGGAQLAAGTAQLTAMDEARSEARRRDGELRAEQLAVLSETSEQLVHTLDALRGEALAARERLGTLAGEIAPEVTRQMERIAAELAQPLREQVAYLGRVHERLEAQTREAGAGAGEAARGSRVGRLFRRG